jgi:hypothetical protein
MEKGAIGRWLRDFEAKNSARKRKSIPGQMELFEDLSLEDAPTTSPTTWTDWSSTNDEGSLDDSVWRMAQVAFHSETAANLFILEPESKV